MEEDFQSISGTVTAINDFNANNTGFIGCTKIISVEGDDGSVTNFIATHDTYFVDHVMLQAGDRVTGFYDANAATPYIFPPQFQALVMSRDTEGRTVAVDHFNNTLESSDGMLRLSPAPSTRIMLENGQAYTRPLGNQNLIAVYRITTRSIPAIATPDQIIVMCR